jgi:hypothetical protein
MMDTSIKENNDIKYKNIWKRNKEHVNEEPLKEERVNEELPEITLSGFAVV